MTKNILFAESALKEVLVYLEKHRSYFFSHIEPLNKNRYFVAHGRKNCPNIAIIFKRAWFETFGDKGFINEQGIQDTGIGDSINCEDLKEFNKRDVKQIFTLYKDGKIYSISMGDFLAQSHRWTNKEGKEVRSISIHNYSRVNKE